MSISISNHETRISQLENKINNSSKFSQTVLWEGSTYGAVNLNQSLSNFNMLEFTFVYHGGRDYDTTMTSMISTNIFKSYGYGYDMRGGNNADRGYGTNISYVSDTRVSGNGRIIMKRVKGVNIG